MSQVYLALYKGRKSGNGIKVRIARLADWVIRKATRGAYSHCEIAELRSDGLYCCRSASLRDGGVRQKIMPLPDDKWDLIPLDVGGSVTAKLYKKTQRRKYDWLGAVGVVGFKGNIKDRWFCSEWCAAALGIAEPWRFSPNDLAAIFKRGRWR